MSGKAVQLIPPVEEADGGRDVRFLQRKARLVFVDGHQAGGILEGQGAQQHAVDDAEDGAVRADAQGEREHDDQREAGLVPEAAEGLAKVGPEFAERVHR